MKRAYLEESAARAGWRPPIDSAVGGVLSLHSDVQPPQHVGDEFLHVLMAAVGEGDASALSVGRRWCGGDDPFRIDDDGLIVRLRELHECHERPAFVGRARGAPKPAARGHQGQACVYPKM
jgi:hypothetical protein